MRIITARHQHLDHAAVFCHREAPHLLSLSCAVLWRMITRLNPEIQMLTENKLIVLPPSTILSIMHIHYSWQVQQSIQQLHRMLMLMSRMSRGLVQRGE